MDLFGEAVGALCGDAVLSDCERYRYTLSRTWDRGKRPACFIMLNPSKADPAVDDPTIRRCVGFAKSWGCGGIVVVNLFAWRATDPKELFDVYYRCQFSGPDGKTCYHNGDPVGEGNDNFIRGAVDECNPVVAAWGVHGVMMLRDAAVRRLIGKTGVRLMCLGTTKEGHPRHPLYVKADQQLVEYRP